MHARYTVYFFIIIFQDKNQQWISATLTKEPRDQFRDTTGHAVATDRIQIHRKYEQTLKKASDGKQNDRLDKTGDVVKETKCINYMFIL